MFTVVSSSNLILSKSMEKQSVLRVGVQILQSTAKLWIDMLEIGRRDDSCRFEAIGYSQ